MAIVDDLSLVDRTILFISIGFGDILKKFVNQRQDSDTIEENLDNMQQKEWVSA